MEAEDKKIEDQFYIMGWCVLGFAGIVCLVLHLSGKQLSNYLPPCMLYVWTGYYCPGCGSTRALMAIQHGHLIKSFLYHPFYVYVIFVGGWYMISQTIERVSRGRVKIAMRFRNIYVFIGLGLLALNWLIKDGFLFFAGIDLMKLIP